MPSVNEITTLSEKQSPPTVAFVAFDGMGALDMAGAQSVFSAATRMMEHAGLSGYRCVTASLEGGLVTTAEGMIIDTLKLEELLPCNGSASSIDTLVVAGAPDILDMMDSASPIADWIARRAPVIRRIVSVCTGSFFLAQAGLLDNKTATTHWSMCERLQSRFPQIRVDGDALYVRQGPIWTSGGVTSGVDLALALVQEDYGRDIAMRVAQELVVFLKRPGGQSQLSEVLICQRQSCDIFDDLHFWLVDNLHRTDLSVSSLAQHMNMSARNFTRLYKQTVGRTPAKTIELFRLSAARRMLEDSDLNIHQVASACGFGDQERMRVTFHRHLALSPREYRNRFVA